MSSVHLIFPTSDPIDWNPTRFDFGSAVYFKIHVPIYMIKIKNTEAGKIELPFTSNNEYAHITDFGNWKLKQYSKIYNLATSEA